MRNTINPDERIWERQEGESEVKYQRFLYYLELGRDRTQAKVAKHFGLRRDTIGEYSAESNWVARAAAYDRFVGSVEHHEEQQKRKTVTDHRLYIKDDEIEDFEFMHRLWLQAGVDMEAEDGISVRSLNEWVGIRDKLSVFLRRAIDMPTRGGMAKIGDTDVDEDTDTWELTDKGTKPVQTKNNLSA